MSHFLRSRRTDSRRTEDRHTFQHFQHFQGKHTFWKSASISLTNSFSNFQWIILPDFQHFPSQGEQFPFPHDGRWRWPSVLQQIYGWHESSQRSGESRSLSDLRRSDQDSAVVLINKICVCHTIGMTRPLETIQRYTKDLVPNWFLWNLLIIHMPSIIIAIILWFLGMACSVHAVSMVFLMLNDQPLRQTSFASAMTWRCSGRTWNCWRRGAGMRLRLPWPQWILWTFLWNLDEQHWKMMNHEHSDPFMFGSFWRFRDDLNSNSSFSATVCYSSGSLRAVDLPCGWKCLLQTVDTSII